MPSFGFISGVVEGFYGRPWTWEQRRRLFARLGQWGMTSYMYAPKDDAKHRSLWRIPYTVPEEAEISGLIRSCQDNDVELIYAISPGLDMTYSCEKEITLLKEKVDQVARLGCRAFAILFDDIESNLGNVDQERFSSFADAHVHVANQLYEHLDRPDVFLFCPTEYCASRASPSVAQSSYLQTVGRDLAANIGVLWTGPQVISKVISVESVMELHGVIRRRPVIWDNLHANDYDRQRLFLGPYQGRPLSLRQHIHGVLTNPNCEYEVNFVAVRTLAAWCASSNEDSFLDVMAVEHEDWSAGVHVAKTPALASGDNNERLLDECCNLEGPTVCASPSKSVDANYSPGTALQTALAEWLADFQRPCVMAAMQSSPETPVSSEAEPSASKTETPPMDVGKDRHEVEGVPTVSVPLTLEQLNLLVDLLYLPFEHGHHAVRLLELFCWLLRFYGHYICNGTGESSMPPSDSGTHASEPSHFDWCSRVLEFHIVCSSIRSMCTSLMQVPNQLLLCELYASVWSIQDIINRLETVVNQLERLDCVAQQRLLEAWKDFTAAPMCLAEGQEPWVFRGGFVGELQRLLPDISWLQDKSVVHADMLCSMDKDGHGPTSSDWMPLSTTVQNTTVC